MASNLPDLITPAEVETLKSGALADLEDLVDDGLEHVRQATFAYVALAVIHARKAYGANFEDYCYERFGISRSSGHRWVKVGKAVLEGAKETPSQNSLEPKKPKEPAGQSVPTSGHSAPIDVTSTDREGGGDTPAAEDEPPLLVVSGPSPSPAGSTSTRGTQDLPSPVPGPSSVEPKPEPQRPGQALTKDQVRTQLAAIRALGVDVISHSVDVEDIKATYNVLADAYRAARDAKRPRPVHPPTSDPFTRPTTVVPNFKKG